jgi:hypothetical protein
MASLQALLDALNGCARMDPRVDPRVEKQIQTCALCGANPSDLQAVLDRESKQQNIHSGQQRLLEMYARDCDGLTRKLAEANAQLEAKDKQLQAMHSQREDDVALLKRAMRELERARDVMRPT